MPLRNSRPLPVLLVALGIGLAAWYGEQRWRLPAWSETEIEQSVDLNLAVELQRRGPHLQPSGERLEELRRTLRTEIEADIRRDREKLERGIGAGLLMAVVGAGLLAGGALLKSGHPD